ncbi:hypothetical protein BJ875DRAFT_538458 [Amylocarpus encephaloides]|uniref:Uncharacterized protein n=1 Tax=Amylocarpus encephaloides TaxID=45428 RepID=A0A9P8CAA0_9HELO|nr:hypothetical protein BJ875DRAFT_538458 [Amylocarpus encephaloides]
MSDDGPRPDLVIAIDFGMTCTGVAFCNVSTGEETVRWLQKWPGRANAVENKVPTVLVYPKNSTEPSSWGFLCEKPTEQVSEYKDCKEWFKTFLDENKLQAAQRNPSTQGVCPGSIQEVEQLYCDFFKLLYQTIQQKLQGEIASRWEDANIEFIFSVPTTWKPVPTVERFRTTIERAGFGRHASHKAGIGLTEAEAAAVHTARVFPKLFKERDILVVCDVGGGTTDLCVLRVTGTNGVGSLSLEQIDVVQGATIGSVQLDTSFEMSARKRIDMANRTMPLGFHPKELDNMAWEMAKSKEYQNAKCDYGSSDDDTEYFTVAVPKLNRAYVNENAGITDGEMKFRRDEIRGYFDTQIIKLFELIDKQISRLQQKFPTEQVAHLVLSGGLGNSAYVQSRLKERYSSGHCAFPNARSLQVRIAPEPQLVVCKGIVADRIQKLKSGKSVLGWRCSRASYGTSCKVLYNPQDPRHFGQQTMKDALDGKLYVTSVVEWFIKQGEPVSIDHPIVKHFTQKCSPSTRLNPSPARAFPTAVVTSDLDKDMLPYVMNACMPLNPRISDPSLIVTYKSHFLAHIAHLPTACRKLCSLTSDFSCLPLSMFKLKNRHWWNTGEKYHRIEFVIKVALGPADIRFELWHNGQKLSNDHPIKVEWCEAEAPPEPVVQVVEGWAAASTANLGNGSANGAWGHRMGGRFEHG